MSWSQTFSYDTFGNLSKSGTISFLPTYSYLTNQMTGVGSSTPTYDANGNATNDTSQTYAWDAAGKPVTINSVGLTYDALGRMVEQSKGANFFQIVYTPRGSKLAIMKGSTLSNAFVSLTGGAQAVYIGSGLQYYRHSDWLGSSRFASKPNQTLFSDGAYAPFGESYAQTGTADLSFTGMNNDTVTNLYDFLAREYSGIQGRWPSPDPAGISAVHLRDPQTWNRYAYVRNNPLKLTDPNGLDPQDDGSDQGICDFDEGGMICSFAPPAGDNDCIAPLACGGDDTSDDGASDSNSGGTSIQSLCPNDTCNATAGPAQTFPDLAFVACYIPSCQDSGPPDVGGNSGTDTPLPSSAYQIIGMVNNMNLDSNIFKFDGISIGGGVAFSTLPLLPSGMAYLEGTFPGFIEGATDFVSGYSTPAYTPTIMGAFGAAASDSTCFPNCIFDTGDSNDPLWAMP